MDVEKTGEHSTHRRATSFPGARKPGRDCASAQVILSQLCQNVFPTFRHPSFQAGCQSDTQTTTQINTGTWPLGGSGWLPAIQMMMMPTEEPD